MEETIEDKRNGGLRARMHEKETLQLKDQELSKELNEPEIEATI